MRCLIEDKAEEVRLPRFRLAMTIFTTPALR